MASTPLVFPKETNKVVVTGRAALANLTHAATVIQLELTGYKFFPGPPPQLKLYCGGIVCVQGAYPFGFAPTSLTIDNSQAQTLDVQAWWNNAGGPTLIWSQALIEYLPKP